jgi:hemerythrin
MPWTPNLSVGVEAIDAQHKIWFEKAEALFEAGKKRQAANYIGELLSFLEDYTKQHFADEEAYMKRIRYPALQMQQQAHAGFIGKLAGIKQEYHSSGGNLSVIMSANSLVINWLTQHISNMDKKIGEYAKGLK